MAEATSKKDGGKSVMELMKFFGEASNKIERYEWAKDSEKNVRINE